MYNAAISHDDIIRAFTRHVPDSYVRDYRDQGGFITVCRGYKNVRWKDGLSTANEYRQIPAYTLVNLPRGYVKPDTLYVGLKLDRPGWRLEFRKAMRFLTSTQMKKITKELNRGEVFPGVRP